MNTSIMNDIVSFGRDFIVVETYSGCLYSRLFYHESNINSITSNDTVSLGRVFILVVKSSGQLSSYSLFYYE